ncbi:MAG: DegT/DnrJ/EryC1/StrS family aminotransferase [Nitrospirae bacterium]|nr:DegT/DnrJ/EryC1/StrS family aminotransferase [Nitrospirota bacterium]
MIPMLDLRLQHKTLEGEIWGQIREVFATGHFILGPQVAAFEQEAAAYHGRPFAVGVASGTDALHLALRASGMGPGDEVITTPFTFIASAEAISYTGARPVFVDIDPETYAIDPGQIEARITPRTKALLPVHLFGCPADLDRLSEIARRHRFRLIEDCAQAFGAIWKGRRVGSIGDAACFSFYPSKNLGGCGDGGMVVTADPDLYQALLRLRNHGSRRGYLHAEVGFNSRLDEIQAAILRVKLPRVDTWNRLRREKAAHYLKGLQGLGLGLPEAREGHVFHQFTIRTSRRERIRAALEAAGVSSIVYYPVPLHLQEAYRHLGYRRGDFPASERAASEVLSLQIYPDLEEAVIDRICLVIREALGV